MPFNPQCVLHTVVLQDRTLALVGAGFCSANDDLMKTNASLQRTIALQADTIARLSADEKAARHMFEKVLEMSKAGISVDLEASLVQYMARHGINVGAGTVLKCRKATPC